MAKFNPATEKMKTYDVSHGLPDREIKGILEDDGGNLWLNTGNGFSRFDPWTETRIVQDFQF